MTEKKNKQSNLNKMLVGVVAKGHLGVFQMIGHTYKYICIRTTIAFFLTRIREKYESILMNIKMGKLILRWENT